MIKIIALTERGRQLAERIVNQLSVIQTECAGVEVNEDCELWLNPKPFTEKVQSAFLNGDKLIFICATGIVVRTLAPVLNSKKTDPPVIVLDEQGQFVIPLLSGHEGGANHWAEKLAKAMNAQLVITTAKAYLNPVFSVGMGCERHCSMVELKALLDSALKQAKLSLKQIVSINSIDIKADEMGLIQLAQSLNLPFQTWNSQQLAKFEPLLSVRSAYIHQVTGVYGVAESAALIGGQHFTRNTPELVLNKIKSKKATCAIARAYPCE